ncbi:hypothetical protein T484DRAFT_1802344 [Baffinella frigidus]|nr:hypothetical protein T484DRAFT_1802344 [Cryptophyta sp. CCMP2293]
MHISSAALIATALLACTSLVDGYSLTPSGAPAGALSEGGRGRTSRPGLRGTASVGPSLLSMPVEEELMAMTHASEASGALHVLKAWGRTVELEEEIAEQAEAMTYQENMLSELRAEVEKQNTTISVLQQEVGQQNAELKAEVKVPLAELRGDLEKQNTANRQQNAELREEVAGLRNENTQQKASLAELKGDLKKQTTANSLMKQTVELQNRIIAGLQRRADALTHVFTWSARTSFSWSNQASHAHTFTEGVQGLGFTGQPEAKQYTHWMGFKLEKGPNCTMHYKCSILDKDDKVLCVVGHEMYSDFQQPPTETAPAGPSKGAAFNLTKTDIAGAAREDGTIKLRMVVHLYLPE